MKRPLVLATSLLLALSACRPDAVALNYHYQEGSRHTYHLTATANADWDIAGAGEGSYEATFLITETILSEDADGSEVSVLMHPTSIEEDGLPSPGPRDRSFTLRLGANGEVQEVISVDGVPAAELDPDELSFIGTYRPPLPLQRVGLGDTWRSRQEVQIGQVFQQVTTTGILEDLAIDEIGKVASVSYEGGGPLVWTTTLPQGNAELTGSADTTTTAQLDIDTGVLRSATSRTDGRFEVRVVATGGVAITGTLRLTLEMKLERST